jgi:prophage regulatory protein
MTRWKMPRLLTFDELRDHGVPFHRSHIHRLEAKGKFPKRVPIGDFRVGWVEEEVDDYVAGRIKSRSTRAGTIGSSGRKGARGRTPAPG